MKLQFEKAGLLTTVQDPGRWGYQAVGMPVAGAMDGFARRTGEIYFQDDRERGLLRGGRGGKGTIRVSMGIPNGRCLACCRLI
jgi:allophanate hydrolase subunit 2